MDSIAKAFGPAKGQSVANGGKLTNVESALSISHAPGDPDVPRSRPAPRPGTRKRPTPRRPATERMGGSRVMKIGFVAFAMLIVCSLLGSALLYIPFDELFDFGDGDDPSTNIPDPNEDIIAEIRETAEANPDDVNAVLLLADVLSNTGNLDEAIPYYEQAIALAPEDTSVRYSFARALADGDRPADAELQFQRVLEMNPDHQGGLYYLAELYMEWDPPRQAEAETLYQQAIEVDPDSFLASQATDRLTTIAPSPAAWASPQASPSVGTPVGDGTGG